VLTAAAGVATVLVVATSSFLEGKLCISCLGTYVLVLGYGAGAWHLWRQRGLPLPWPGLKLALGATLVAYLGLLVPGLRTPHDADSQGQEHLPSTAAPAPSVPAAPAGSHLLHGVDIGRFIAGLPPQARQSLSDSLGIYRSAGPVAARPPRALDGPANARVRITDFTDSLCGHCAALHDTINLLKQRLPRGLMAIDARHFPLDASCNSAITSPPKNSVRCLAAKAQICMEGRSGHDAFVGKLFALQEDLNEELVYSLAEPHMSREELDVCAASGDTVRKLEDDIARPSLPSSTPSS
jgi:serine/threonine-protein kinase